jgi:lysozyme
MYTIKIISPTFAKLSDNPKDSSELSKLETIFLPKDTILKATELIESLEGHFRFIILPTEDFPLIKDKITAWLFVKHIKVNPPISSEKDSSVQHINSKGLNLVKEFEGLRLKAYLDVVGIPTIGYGSTYYSSGRKVTLNDSLSSIEEAEELLLNTLENFEETVSENVKVPLNSNQFSALVSFVYNIGITAFKNSTLLRVLNQKNYDQAANEFLRWDKGLGKTLLGLTRRREKERKLFLSLI